MWHLLHFPEHSLLSDSALLWFVPNLRDFTSCLWKALELFIAHRNVPKPTQIRTLFLPYRYPLSLYPCSTSALVHQTKKVHKVAVVIPIYKASKYTANSLCPLQKSIFVQSLILT